MSRQITFNHVAQLESYEQASRLAPRPRLPSDGIATINRPDPVVHHRHISNASDPPDLQIVSVSRAFHQPCRSGNVALECLVGIKMQLAGKCAMLSMSMPALTMHEAVLRHTCCRMLQGRKEKAGSTQQLLLEHHKAGRVRKLLPQDAFITSTGPQVKVIVWFS